MSQIPEPADFMKMTLLMKALARQQQSVSQSFIWSRQSLRRLNWLLEEGLEKCPPESLRSQIEIIRDEQNALLAVLADPDAHERAGSSATAADFIHSAIVTAELNADPRYQAAIVDAETVSWDEPGVSVEEMIKAADERRRAAGEQVKGD